METNGIAPALLPLDALPITKSDQMLGWIHSQLTAGKSFTAEDWNRAVTELAARA